MSPIRVRIGVTLGIGMLLLAAACSDTRKESVPFNSETGKHPTNWNVPTAHGAAAKASTGFSSCQICHGSDFTGGLSTRSCLNTAGCHGAAVSSPHSPIPWRGGARTHTDTNTNNAPVCALCHTNGQNLVSIPAPTPPPPGTPPGCFNITLCHGPAGHAAGWANPDTHGAAAKSAPNATAMQGFSTCQACHGANFAGDAATTCFTCHGVSAPHAFPW